MAWKACVIALAACAGLAMKTLEFRDVQGFELEQRSRDGAVSLHVSGLAFHSALAVHGIETSSSGDEILVRVKLGPARKGLSGSFAVDVDVPPQVRRVLFGDERHAIWVREG